MSKDAKIALWVAAAFVVYHYFLAPAASQSS